LLVRQHLTGYSRSFLIGDVIQPIPLESGQSKREHYEYQKNGSCALLLAVEPLTGWRLARVYPRRTAKEYTEFMQEVIQHFPTAIKIKIVQDNLNTHKPSSFYKHLEPQKAFMLSQKIQMCYTPKKASWLNIAELEFSALSKQCLDRRIGTFELFSSEVEAWVQARNQAQIKIHWQFSIDKARVKFKKKYEGLKT
jgi:hypothetical protein